MPVQMFKPIQTAGSTIEDVLKVGAMKKRIVPCEMRSRVKRMKSCLRDFD